jgi:uncharacterized protein YdhG (YjbR/CyaY superfamily)
VSAPRFTSLNDYLASLDVVKATTLHAVVDAITGYFPNLTVKIAWNVPQVHRGKDYVFGMSAAKNHLTLAPWGTGTLEPFRARLADYVVNKATFQVPVDWNVDAYLLRDMVAARLAELDGEIKPQTKNRDFRG